MKLCFSLVAFLLIIFLKQEPWAIEATIKDDQTTSVGEKNNDNSMIINRLEQKTTTRSHFMLAVEQMKKLVDFKAYKNFFHKRYDGIHEQMHRLKLFTARSLQAVKHLFKYHSGKSSYYITINKFTDRTSQELAIYSANTETPNLSTSRNISLLRKKRQANQSKESKNPFSFFSKLGIIPTKKIASQVDFDWRQESGCLQEPIDQGDCGSCYAMASTKLFEWLYCRQFNNERVKFSEQYMINCGNRKQLKGCQSGSLKNTIHFVETFGLIANNKLPYKAKEGECPLSENQSPNNVSYIIVPKVSKLEAMTSLAQWEESMRQQPLIVFLKAPEDFNFYSGGVYKPKSKQCKDSTGHFVVLIGSGVEDNRQYFTFSNSFGPDWGMNGYIRFDKKSPCIEYMAKVDLKFEQKL